MYHTPDADHRSKGRQKCLRGTGRNVLRGIEHWLAGEPSQHVFWLSGLAGTGKSTIAQTLAEITFADAELGASFFCSRDSEDRSNLQMLFPTLAFQLACQHLEFRMELLQVLRTIPHDGSKSLDSQMEELIVRPLQAANIRTLIIIDALDECKDEQPVYAILLTLSRYANKVPKVKFFITGQPKTQIHLESLAPSIRLHELKPEAVGHDIKLFFQTQLRTLMKNQVDWQTSVDIENLCKQAAGSFIYASTVVRFASSGITSPLESLALITLPLHGTSREQKSRVDQLYTRVLEQGTYADKNYYPQFRHVVGTILLLFNPLSIKGLSELLGCDTSYINRIIYPLCSLLLIPENEEGQILTFHKSFPDFLMNPNCCKGKWFFVEQPAHHAEILLLSLKFMRERLKGNICNLGSYAVLSKVEDLSDRRKKYIGDTLGYVCQFWTKHLLGIPRSSPQVKGVQKAIDRFFKKRFLHWIEVLALMGSLDVGVHAINDIKQWYERVSVVQFIFRDPYS